MKLNFITRPMSQKHDGGAIQEEFLDVTGSRVEARAKEKGLCNLVVAAEKDTDSDVNLVGVLLRTRAMSRCALVAPISLVPGIPNKRS